MALPEHLHPKTYWENRREILEQSLQRALNIIAVCGSQQQRDMLQAHADEWSRIQQELIVEHPAPEKGGKE